jgi:hypothetical protein
LRINAVVIRDGGFEGVQWCSVDSGNLFQSVIVLGKKDSFLYSVLQDGIWKRLVWECRVCLFCGMSLSVFWRGYLQGSENGRVVTIEIFW